MAKYLLTLKRTIVVNVEWSDDRDHWVNHPARDLTPDDLDNLILEGEIESDAVKVDRATPISIK